MAPTILGVDPGARETGLVVVRGDELIGSDVIRAEGKLDPHNPVDPVYLRALRICLEALLGRAGVGHGLDAVAIENVAAPNPHLGMTNAAGIVAVGAVVGMLWSWAYDLGDPVPVMLIDTEGHGSSLLAGYPKDLQPTRGQGKGTDILRHARSAYDVALAARWYLRIERASV